MHQFAFLVYKPLPYQDNGNIHDLVDHFIMHCQCNQPIELRNTLMESVLEVLSVERSVEFCNQDECLILEGLLGGTSNMLAAIKSDVWERFMS
jgi:hypothetical protein